VQSKLQRIYAAHPELNARLLEVLPLGRHTVPLMEVENVGGGLGERYVDPDTNRSYEIVWIRSYLLDVYVWVDDARVGGTAERFAEVQASIQITDTALRLVDSITGERIYSWLTQDAAGLQWQHPGDDLDLRNQRRASRG
jgi:hypothetical protein